VAFVKAKWDVDVEGGDDCRGERLGVEDCGGLLEGKHLRTRGYRLLRDWLWQDRPANWAGRIGDVS
jgi:hypothetical protein